MDPADLWNTRRPIIFLSWKTEPRFWFRPNLADIEDPRDVAWMREACRASIRPEWNVEALCWTVAAVHLERVILGAVKRYRHCDVLLESLDIEKCTTGCQAANPETWRDCTCPCHAEYHGLGQGGGWRHVGEYLLIQADRNWAFREWDGWAALEHITSLHGIRLIRA